MKEEKLKQLLDKYYNGNTSSAEENELKDYFSGNKIFPGYETEKEIFSHYSHSEKIPLPAVDFESRILRAIDNLEVNTRKILIRKRYISYLGTAATILILVGYYLIFFQAREPADSFSDPELAYAETMKILYHVSVQLNRGTMTLEPIGKINSAAQTSIKSVDRSVSVISDYLKRFGFSDVIWETENKRNN